MVAIAGDPLLEVKPPNLAAAITRPRSDNLMSCERIAGRMRPRSCFHE